MRKGPIFVVGCPRSGTSLTRHLLDAHPHIACGPETHFLPAFERILQQDWSRMKGYGYDQDYWHSKIADFFDSFKQEYAQQQGKGRWAEKTPGYAFKLKFIEALFPNCQVIHVIRNGLDVVLSYRERWGYAKAMEATRHWQLSIKTAQAWGQQAANDRYYEVFYEDLVRTPEAAIKPIFQFLQEPWDPVILEKGTYSNAFTTARRQQGQTEDAFYTSRIGQGQRQLDPLLKGLFHQRSGQLYRQLGYGK